MLRKHHTSVSVSIRLVEWSDLKFLRVNFMVLLCQVATINERVRFHFASGLKSANKTYSLYHGSKNSTRKLLRNANANLASREIVFQRSNDLSAEAMLALPPDRRVGNCGEYAQLAAHFSLSLQCPIWEFTARHLLGFDHVFCVLDIPDHPSRLRRVLDMSLQRSRAQSIVCDPWANIVCAYSHYPAALKNKLEKWNEKGKRITARDNPESNAVEWARKILQSPVECEQLA